MNYWWKKRFLEQSTYVLPVFQVDMDRYKMCTSKKSPRQIRKEIKILQKYWNSYPFQYFRFDMYRNDCTLSIEEMKDYTSYYFFGHLFWVYSYKQYHDLIQNKFFCYTLFKGFNENQAKILFLCVDSYIYDIYNNPISDTNVEILLKQTFAPKLFFKPNKGSWGIGIIVFKRDNAGDYRDHNNEQLNAEYIRKHLIKDDYFLQEGIIQSKSMSDIYPEAVNTIRVMTSCFNQKPEILFTMLHMGKGGAQIDNASSGGIFIDVDKETGRLGEHAFEHGLKQNIYTHHPDTGILFKGYQIDGWNILKEFVLRNALKMRELNYVGWDIALTDSGPLLVELNARPDTELLQAPKGGVRKNFNVEPSEWFSKNDWHLNWVRNY